MPHLLLLLLLLGLAATPAQPSTRAEQALSARWSGYREAEAAVRAAYAKYTPCKLDRLVAAVVGPHNEERMLPCFARPTTINLPACHEAMVAVAYDIHTACYSVHLPTTAQGWRVYGLDQHIYVCGGLYTYRGWRQWCVTHMEHNHLRVAWDPARVSGDDMWLPAGLAQLKPMARASLRT